MSILSQIIAYAPNKIDTETKAQALAIGPRAMVGEITDEQTQFGRPIYQTPAGEKVSEKSTTLFFNGDWMNVPSIHGGKSFNEDELRLMIKQGNLQPTSVHKSRADAEAAAKARSDSMVQGPRNMYDGGGAAKQLLAQPNADGSRPGYATSTVKKGKFKYPFTNQHGTFYSDTKRDTRGGENRSRFDSKKEKLIMKQFNLTEKDFINHGKYGVPQIIDGKINPKYTSIQKFKNAGFKVKAPVVKKSETVTSKVQEIIKNNFELPKNQEWNFKSKENPNGFKYGVGGREDMALTKRIERKLNNILNKKQKYTLAADNSTAKGWMMHAMERLYNQEKKLNIKNLTYVPKFNDQGIIIGFTDTTKAGGNKTYYGLNKNMQEDGAAWTSHANHNRIKKFIDIADGVKAKPDEVLQKILDDKGISKLGGSKRVGEKFTLTLNDVLSHERYYDILSKTSPKALLERQIVLHHKKRIGGDLAKAAATKDLQLLTGAVNANVNKLENTAKKRKLNVDEIAELKNYNAKITNFDGRVVGGGSTDPIKQFAAIEKEALDYAKSDKFNVKTVASYLERLGCGQAAGGRILFAEGVPSLTKCAQKGVAKIENGLKNGFKNADDAVLARGILKSGKFLKDAVSLRGLFGPLALGFTVAAEAGLVGYDMLSSGKSFREAVGASVFNYALGDKTKIDSEEEIIKRLQNIKTGPQNYQRMGDEEIGKMQYFKENLKDLGTGFDLYNKLGAIQKNRDAIGMSPEDTFNEGAFQLDLDRQEDAARADIQDYNRTNTPNRVTDYLLSDAAKEGADATALANLLVEQDRLQDAGIGNIYQSRKGDKKRIQRGKEIGYEIENLLNPNKLDEFGEYFISRPQSEQSKIMSYGYREGGIASLNVKK